MSTVVEDKELNDFFKSHPALILTLLFIQISTVGMVYDYALLQQFGINVFQFAELNDFFLAAFKEPFVLIQSVLTLFVIPAVLGITKNRWDLVSSLIHKKKTMYFGTIFIILVYTLIPPYLGGKSAGKVLANGWNSIDKVYLVRKTNPNGMFPDKEPLYLVTSTDKFMFFYNDKSKTVKVLNLANFAGLERKVN